MVKALKSSKISLVVNKKLTHSCYGETEDLILPMAQFFSQKYPGQPVMETGLVDNRAALYNLTPESNLLLKL